MKRLYEPKPCPNCGDGEQLQFRYSIAHGEPYQTRVRCESCGAEGPFVRGMDEMGATEKWNACEYPWVVQLYPHPLDGAM